MKKTMLSIAALLVATVASAQFYVSASGGYAFGVDSKIGEEGVKPNRKDLKGSYGKGINTQLRGGYFFTEKIGVELGFGYLYGADQLVRKIAIENEPAVEVNAHGRAFGASLAGIYNFTDNIFVRAGLLTKVGGKTEATGNVKAALQSPGGPVPVTVNFTSDFNGKMPFGFIGAVGYKYPITDNLAIFGEVEYMNISVTRKTSELKDFSATVAGKALAGSYKEQRDALLKQLKGQPKAVQAKLGELLPLVQDKTEWGKNGLPAPDAPYSSFGINIGITYSFK